MTDLEMMVGRGHMVAKRNIASQNLLNQILPPIITYNQI
jgi:hypothetical protein